MVLSVVISWSDHLLKRLLKRKDIRGYFLYLKSKDLPVIPRIDVFLKTPSETLRVETVGCNVTIHLLIYVYS